MPGWTTCLLISITCKFQSKTMDVPAGGRNCPMTGVQLSGTVKLQADVALQEEITAWLQAQGKDPDTIRRAISLAWRNADMCGESATRRPWQAVPASNLLMFAKEVPGLLRGDATAVTHSCVLMYPAIPTWWCRQEGAIAAEQAAKAAAPRRHSQCHDQLPHVQDLRQGVC